MKLKIVLPILAVLIAVVAAVIFIAQTGGGKSRAPTQIEKSQAQVEVGSTAPNFTLSDFSGNSVSLSNFAGKPVFIDFWASWCPPCVEEIPEIQKISQEFGELVVLGIHRTETESKEIGVAFAQGLGVTYLLLQDPKGEVYKIYTQGQRFMPYAVFIDKNGVIVEKKAGAKTVDEMREKVKKIL